MLLKRGKINDRKRAAPMILRLRQRPPTACRGDKPYSGLPFDTRSCSIFVIETWTGQPFSRQRMSQSQTESWVRIRVEPAELKELMRRQDAIPSYFALFPASGGACLTVRLGTLERRHRAVRLRTLYSTGAQSRETEPGRYRLPHEMAEQALSRSPASWRCARPFFAHSHDAPQTHHPSTRSRDRDAGATAMPSL